MMNLQRATLLIDKKQCVANIQAMLAKTQEFDVTFRPHFKTHQSIEIGRWYRQQGVKAITVSSLKMAKQFAADGWYDITVGIPINVNQYEEINALAGRIDLNILVEDVPTVELLTETLTSSVGVFVKVDTGFHRTGIDVKHSDEIHEVMLAIKHASGMIPKGLLTYSGHTHETNNRDEIFAIHQHAVEAMRYLKQILLLDFPNIKLSIGDTPSCKLASDFEEIDEIRPGTFLFNDCQQSKIGSCSNNEISMIVAAPVIALHTERSEVVIHCGSVHLSKESYKKNDGTTSYGAIVLLNEEGMISETTDAYVSNLSQEHGIVTVPESLLTKITVGSSLGIIPVHCCITNNLMKEQSQIIIHNDKERETDIRQKKWIYDTI